MIRQAKLWRAPFMEALLKQGRRSPMRGIHLNDLQILLRFLLTVFLFHIFNQMNFPVRLMA